MCSGVGCPVSASVNRARKVGAGAVNGFVQERRVIAARAFAVDDGFELSTPPRLRLQQRLGLVTSVGRRSAGPYQRRCRKPAVVVRPQSLACVVSSSARRSWRCGRPWCSRRRLAPRRSQRPRYHAADEGRHVCLGDGHRLGVHNVDRLPRRGRRLLSLLPPSAADDEDD